MNTTPHKSDHAHLLNALDDMQQTLLYKARKNVLSQAETLIVNQEQQIKELKEKLNIQSTVEQPSMSDLIATHQVPKAKRMAELCAEQPSNPVPLMEALREIMGDIYLRMEKSYSAEPTRRITFMDMEAMHAHVKRLGIGGCLDEAARIVGQQTKGGE